MSAVTRNRLIAMVLTLGVIGLPVAGQAAYLPGGGHFARAKVMDVQPIVRIVQISTPREVCWDEPVRQRRHGHGHGRRHRSFVPTVLGGIIGGVVGNKFGSGRGNDVMTVAGAVLGASIGNDAGAQHQRPAGPRYVAARHCEIEESVHEEERIEGYRVTYRFKGQEYVTKMDEKPGRDIRVHVRVVPAE
ncbi:MAG: glycine zipper 2TM domain-containing protein [Gammaproteobacteria bacterium]|nr:glycine zipper 2TM domain-containing protein [Gammaproteobacteria bacterium]MDP7153422.1 glycine zipper 2TM domain-containing protein [Gammaproteobacteria bacterium]MDP7418784.1 glycine zipper 2TM domain-containing protein [Gammaproteobacteria bacterium]MDP7661146.1 glycine zipper 2TM domain-containing protein [Gammaproteobacteria bacterium]